MVAPRRLLAERASSQNPVFSYRFNQVTQNMSMEVGVSDAFLLLEHRSELTSPYNILASRSALFLLGSQVTHFQVSPLHHPYGSQHY
jgi:hypothetical protein